MNPIIIGNIVSFIGCALMVAIGFLKKKEHILIAQCGQFTFQAAGHLILGAISGFACGVVGILRNLIFLKWKSTNFLKVVFILIQAALSFKALQTGPVEWLPLLAAILFTWFLDTKDPVKLKIVIIITQIMWVVYDVYYQNYSATAFDGFTILSTAWGIALFKKSASTDGDVP